MYRRLNSVGLAVLLAICVVPNASAQQRPRGLPAATSAEGASSSRKEASGPEALASMFAEKAPDSEP